MKKIWFGLTILIIAVSLSACSLKTAPPTSEENAAPLSANQDEDFNLADNTKPSAPASNLTAPETSVSTSTAPANSNNNMIDPKTFTDLTKEYSQAVIKTNLGAITVKFYTKDSPFTVNNFLNLAQAGFYNGTKFHRVIKDFMIQGGDPLSKGTDSSVYGTGGPGYRFPDEFNSHKLVLGSLAMANSGADTNGSQFFIVTAQETPWLDGHHTNFGEVVKGLDIVQQIGNVATGANDRPTTDVVIDSIELLK